VVLALRAADFRGTARCAGIEDDWPIGLRRTGALYERVEQTIGSAETTTGWRFFRPANTTAAASVSL